MQLQRTTVKEKEKKRQLSLSLSPSNLLPLPLSVSPPLFPSNLLLLHEKRPKKLSAPAEAPPRVSHTTKLSSEIKTVTTLHTSPSSCSQGSSRTPTTPTKAKNTNPTKEQQMSLPTKNTRKIHHHRRLHNSKPSLTQKSHTQAKKPGARRVTKRFQISNFSFQLIVFTHPNSNISIFKFSILDASHRDFNFQL
jgi:hypothetical protein